MRTARLDNVEMSVQAVRDDWPNGEFDLIVLKDFVYNLNEADVGAVVRHAVGSLCPGGCLLVAAAARATRMKTSSTIGGCDPVSPSSTSLERPTGSRRSPIVASTSCVHR